MLVYQAQTLLSPAFVEHYVLDLDAGFEPSSVQESDDILFVWMSGNEL